ncbi:acyl-CoA N-acyltransferase [Meredithblackwellia eburnea MCA 4105]
MSPTGPLRVELCQTPEEIKRCFVIRKEVFVDEQGYELRDEFDKKDGMSDHFVLLDGDTPIGTIRYWAPGAKLGRLAVVKAGRGVGAGRYLVQAMEEHVVGRKGGKAGEQHKDDKEVTIHANSQAYAQKFYEKMGYTVEGEHFLEDGQPHIRLVKTVTLK